MCSIRKGTSTRKPKLNPDMVEVQVRWWYNWTSLTYIKGCVDCLGQCWLVKMKSTILLMFFFLFNWIFMYFIHVFYATNMTDCRKNVMLQVQKHAFMPPSPLIRFPREEHPRPSSSASNEANQSFEDMDEAGPSSKPKKMKTPAKPRPPKTPGVAGGGRGKLKNIDRNTIKYSFLYNVH